MDYKQTFLKMKKCEAKDYNEKEKYKKDLREKFGNSTKYTAQYSLISKIIYMKISL